MKKIALTSLICTLVLLSCHPFKAKQPSLPKNIPDDIQITFSIRDNQSKKFEMVYLSSEDCFAQFNIENANSKFPINVSVEEVKALYESILKFHPNNMLSTFRDTSHLNADTSLWLYSNSPRKEFRICNTQVEKIKSGSRLQWDSIVTTFTHFVNSKIENKMIDLQVLLDNSLSKDSLLFMIEVNEDPIWMKKINSQITPHGVDSFNYKFLPGENYLSMNFIKKGIGRNVYNEVYVMTKALTIDDSDKVLIVSYSKIDSIFRLDLRK